jgi:glc operon protein GlcG
MKTRSVLTLDDVKLLLQAAEQEALKNNWQVAIAVLDDGAHLLGFVRMDGATPANAKIAIEKAGTAALSRRSSKSS